MCYKVNFLTQIILFLLHVGDRKWPSDNAFIGNSGAVPTQDEIYVPNVSRMGSKIDWVNILVLCENEFSGKMRTYYHSYHSTI